MPPPLDPAAERRHMVAWQIERRGVRDPRVLRAMEQVPREQFAPPELRQQAFADRALPIDCGQTISQPYIVALMTEALELSGDQRVLEIGTGSGYQTAVLAQLAREVFTIERHEPLSLQAQSRLRQLGCANVRFRVGDGAQGWPEAAPFDRIIVTAAAPECPPALWEQLAEGGVVVGPFGRGDSQILQAIRKTRGEPERRGLVACRFVPLVSP